MLAIGSLLVLSATLPLTGDQGCILPSPLRVPLTVMLTQHLKTSQRKGRKMAKAPPSARTTLHQTLLLPLGEENAPLLTQMLRTVGWIPRPRRGRRPARRPRKSRKFAARLFPCAIIGPFLSSIVCMSVFGMALGTYFFAQNLTTSLDKSCNKEEFILCVH